MSENAAQDQDQLVQWLKDECKDRNLSWAKASRRAGVSETTISEIIRGSSIGLKRVTKLAHYFGVDPIKLLRMAGYMPSESSRDEFDDVAEIFASLPEPYRREALIPIRAIARDAQRRAQRERSE